MHHSTTAHIAPPGTHQHTNTAQIPHTPHAPKPGQPPHGRAVHPDPRTRAHRKLVTGHTCPPHGRADRGGRAHLTPGAPSQWRGAPPPRGRPPATPTARNDGSQERTMWGRCWVPTPTPTAPGKHGSRNPGRPPQRPDGRIEAAPDTRRPSQQCKATPAPERPPTTPAARSPPQGMQAKGTVLGPHARTTVLKARG